MILDYLRNEKQEVDELLKRDRDELSGLGTKLLENEKFCALLESETQKVFRDFTPRDVDNKNRKKIQELKEEREKLIIRKEIVEAEIEAATTKESSLREGIAEVKELEMQAADSKWYEENLYNAGNKDGEPIDDSFIHGRAADKVKEIIKYLVDDPIKAKNEIIKMLP